MSEATTSDQDMDNEDTPDLPDVLPIFPLTGAILLPYCVLPLNIFEPRYLAMVRDAAAAEGVIGMVQPRPPKAGEDENPQKPAIYQIGGAGHIRRMEETDDGRIMIELLGVTRFRIHEELETLTPYRQVKPDWDAFDVDIDPDWDQPVTERESFLETLYAFLKAENLDADLSAIEDAPDLVLANSLAMALPFEPTEKQALVEAVSVEDRMNTLATLMDMSVRARTAGTSDDLN